MPGCTRVCLLFSQIDSRDKFVRRTVANHMLETGIGPKVTQSVLTAAFLFAFKDVLYEYSVRLRGSLAKKAVTV